MCLIRCVRRTKNSASNYEVNTTQAVTPLRKQSARAFYFTFAHAHTHTHTHTHAHMRITVPIDPSEIRSDPEKVGEKQKQTRCERILATPQFRNDARESSQEPETDTIRENRDDRESETTHKNRE